MSSANTTTNTLPSTIPVTVVPIAEPCTRIEQRESDVEELIKGYHELFTRIEEIEKKAERAQIKQEKLNQHVVYRSYG